MLALRMKHILRSTLAAILALQAGAVAAGRLPEASGLDLRQVISGAKDRVFPAVVFIKCLAENYDGGRRITQEVSGSGVLISAEGELITNCHVVDKAVQVRCLLADGRAFEASVVGRDQDTDLALVKLKVGKDEKPIPFAQLGTSAGLKEGDIVMAMGAPWGLSRSVSLGILSCTRRFLPEASEYSLWLQTDASISPGNSGGPLVDTEGRVIGLNTRGVLQGGDMGFAIPADTIAQVLPELRQGGKVDWSWTGLQLQPIRDFHRNIYFEGTEGVIVADVDSDSPARKAGFQPRDRILKVNGRPVTAMVEEDLPAVRLMLALLPKDKPADFEVLRGEKKQALAMVPTAKGKVEGDLLDCPRWDLTVKSINQFDTPDLFFSRKQGVFVHGLKYPGNAAAAGLQNRDIILKIDGREITSLDDVKEIHGDALKNLETRHRMVMVVLRNGLMKQIVLDFSRDFAKE